MLRQYTALILLFLFASASLALAQTPPIPPHKGDSLETLETRLKNEKKQVRTLEKQEKKTKKEIESASQKLISLANDILENETSLRAYETRISDLEDKKEDINESLEEDRIHIQNILLALTKMRRIPQEAMIAHPESPYKIAQSALLMEKILPTINAHVATLNTKLETYHSVTTSLEEERNALQSNLNKLKGQQNEIADLVSTRQKLYKGLNSELKAHTASIQRISLQAQNLKDLVARIDQEEKAEDKRRAERNKKQIADLAAIPKGNDAAKLPISGLIKIGYKQKNDRGVVSNGLTLEGRKGGLVVAPLAGRIKFAGTFKRYGEIVIIEHHNNYHSLIAGFDKINVKVGTVLKTGEPIGTLPNSSFNPRPTLYYELRKNGKIVNPKTKFSGIS